MYESIEESICQENFEKICQIIFVKKAVKGVVEKCYNPFEKVCDGTGPESCKTVHETSCTTKYEMTDSNSTNPSPLCRVRKDNKNATNYGENMLDGNSTVGYRVISNKLEIS